MNKDNKGNNPRPFVEGSKDVNAFQAMPFAKGLTNEIKEKVRWNHEFTTISRFNLPRCY